MSIKVLLVDVDKEYANSFATQAKEYQIRVSHLTNFRKMEQYLPVLAGIISWIILEVECLIEPDSPAPRDDFLPKALSLLDKKYIHIPRRILTVNRAENKNILKYRPDEILYIKATDEKKLLEEIYSLTSEKIEIQRQYSDLFRIIDYHKLPAEIETQLMAILTKQDSEDFVIIKDNLTRAREILESLFKTINKERKDIIPDEYLRDNGIIKFRELHKYLNGMREYKTNHKPISDVYYLGATAELAELIYNVGSKHGAHFSNPDHCLTKYTVKSCINALLECILWFDQIMRKK
ncbi:hypothetical protein [Clostridium sp.]|uniref:hypothetical protein n=1 Tax=Clostridium sp. TaxID=1506 RepID=UPI00284A6073|nr:hypothetical protein [Clostridium sp.]MDR3598835.1 hypothetical protein [Clostridium sp.]